VEITDVTPQARLTGEIMARTESDFSFRTDGKLVARLVDVGAFVRKDQVLARLDTDDANNRLANAVALLDVARADLRLAQSDEARQRELLARGVSTQARYDDALRTLRAAQARQESAQADFRVAQDRVAYTELKAEFDGVVTAVGADLGRVVGAGQMVVRVARPEEKDAVFGVPERMFLESTGEPPPIEITLAASPEIKTIGVVREVAPQADPVTRTFQAKVSLPNAPIEMRLGSVVIGRALLEPRPAVSLPAAALFKSGASPAVWVVDPATNMVALKPIKVLRYDTGVVIVESGVNKGDVVVTAGVNILREGQKVRLPQGLVQGAPQTMSQGGTRP
jgi:RND family efflux transporter MFP subunit